MLGIRYNFLGVVTITENLKSIMIIIIILITVDLIAVVVVVVDIINTIDTWRHSSPKSAATSMNMLSMFCTGNLSRDSSVDSTARSLSRTACLRCKLRLLLQDSPVAIRRSNE